ncbi:hypothetical protein GF406_09360 [candidate division KSB1 bacterium]|jgi:hypothetical protein|nr:hypothetical protein [candidate division KSB1 bacterium]
MLKPKIFHLILCLVVWPFLATAQDSNIEYPVETIENFLKHDTLEIMVPREIRANAALAKTAVLANPEGFFLRVKVKQASKGGEAPNNEPRYENAAYALQKLFLTEPEFVVPPNVIRAFPLKKFREQVNPHAEPTFKGTSSVVCDIQYWLNNITKFDKIDPARFESDSLYAHHVANFNILTYLIKHSDSNEGNFLISTDPLNPRVFAVDNGVAFGSPESTRGTYWKELRIDRAPRSTVDRLRTINRDVLNKTLAVVAQFNVEDDQLIMTEPASMFAGYKGVRTKSDIVQFGLTTLEIDGVERRLDWFLDRVDSGKLKLF